MNTNQTRLSGISTYEMTLTALMTAVTCVAGPLSIPIPISPVPLSLTNLAIFLTTCLLGWKSGTISYLLYLIMGIIGIPVFSGFTAGFGKLAGPTGGYLIGMIFTAMICGLVFEHSGNPLATVFGLFLGTAVSYAFGTIWLCMVMHLTARQGLAAGVIPYIPGDLCKMILAALMGPKMKRRLQAAGVLRTG